MEQHKSHDQIAGDIEAAKAEIEIGASYAHYKDPNKVYSPQSFATLEADDELCVIYQARYGRRLTFVRPVREWIEEVDWHGATVRRFTKL